MKYVFTNEKIGLRLTEFLSEKISGITLSQLKKQLKLGEVKINGKRVKENALLCDGDCVEIFLPQRAVRMPQVITVYEDENILIADKPANVDTENNLVQILQVQKGLALLPVHRLDRNTEGLVILAKDEESERLLQEAVKNRTVLKIYHALLYGNFDKKEFTDEAFLKKDAANGLVTISRQKETASKKIITAFKILADYDGYCKAEIQLITGRTHQIRAHAAFLKHPVLGDGKYGNGAANRKFGYKRQQLKAVCIRFDGLKGKLSYLNGMEIYDSGE